MSNERPDEDARRAYWAKRLEEGYDFVEKMTQFPVDECGQGLAALPRAVEQSGVGNRFLHRLHELVEQDGLEVLGDLLDFASRRRGPYEGILGRSRGGAGGHVTGIG